MCPCALLAGEPDAACGRRNNHSNTRPKQAIAELVPGRTDKECIKRVKEIKALLAAKSSS